MCHGKQQSGRRRGGSRGRRLAPRRCKQGASAAPGRQQSSAFIRKAEQAGLHSSSLAFAVSLVNPAGQRGICYIKALTPTGEVMRVIYVDEAVKNKKGPLTSQPDRQLNGAGREERLVIDQIGDMMDGALFCLSDARAQIQTAVVSGEGSIGETNKQTKKSNKNVSQYCRESTPQGEAAKGQRGCSLLIY